MKKVLTIISVSVLMLTASFLIPDLRTESANADEKIVYKIECIVDPNDVCIYTIYDQILDIRTGKFVTIIVEDPNDDTHL